MAEYIDKNRLILCMNDWMLQNAPVKAGDDTIRADTILDAIKMVEDSPAALVTNQNRLTNADRIRAMSDEELAEWLDGLISHCNDGPCFTCFMQKACLTNMLDWLKSPVEVENGGTDT